MKSKLGYIVLTLAIAQILLIFLSWLITAAAIDLPLRSLLSTEECVGCLVLSWLIS